MSGERMNMRVPIYSLSGEAAGEIQLAPTFSLPVRADLIRRAVLAEQSRLRQPYGADPLAGKRTSAHYHGRRGRRMSMMNREMARMKRIHGQGYLNFTARFVPQAVKGRKAHPPVTHKVWARKVNKKEMRKALLSAVAATAVTDLVLSRGHRIDAAARLPLIVDDTFEGLTKIREVKAVLERLGLAAEIMRPKKRAIRAGRGKRRNRKHRRKKGLLIVVKQDRGIIRAARNLPGLDAVTVGGLTVSLLAPGSHPGRLCLWTQSACKEMEKLQ
jgi:large subunit ribosomal protein L4e